MATTSPGYSITIRAEAPPAFGATAELAAAVMNAGGVADRPGRRRVPAGHDRRRRDLRRHRRRARRPGHRVDRASCPGCSVRKVSDRTFLLHLGGKLEVVPKVPLKHRDDLSRAYTPGVARVCLAIAKNPADARRLTIKRNTVAVVTDGSAVLGLGDIGPAAALPVMEGKAALFKQFAGVDAWPVCLDTQDTDLIVEIVRCHRAAVRRDQPRGHRRAAVLRDRAAAAGAAGHPGVPRRPARHRDRGAGRADQRAAGGRQEAGGRPGGGLRGRRRRPGDHPAAAPAGLHRHHRLRPARRDAARTIRTWTSSAGGSPTTPTRAARRARWPRCWSTPTSSSGCPRRTCSPATTSPRWRTGRSCSRCPTPTPRSTRSRPSQHAAIVATGRSDYPNQINNVLAFPGFFRGMLDAGAHEITDDCLLAAATAIADCVEPGRAERQLHRAVGVRPRGRAGRRGRGPRRSDQREPLTLIAAPIRADARRGRDPGQLIEPGRTRCGSARSVAGAGVSRQAAASTAARGQS